MACGVFIVSLDFEMLWGVQSSCGIDNYRDNILGVRDIVDDMLTTFAEYHIHATWACVGFLFAENMAALNRFLPERDMRPAYNDESFNSYRCLEWLEKDRSIERYIFASELIKKISETENQEIASHTLSHYFCKSSGQTLAQFKADVAANKNIATELFELELKTLVFPRNQCVAEYVEALDELGIVAFRGEEDDWIHTRMGDSILMRFLRLLDSYIPLTGQGGYLPMRTPDGTLNLKGSRFLRPYNRKLAIFERLKMRRIKRQMLYSAKNGLVFHLWWHPHNFGVRQEYHLAFLKEILEYYRVLSEKYGMRSLNMLEASRKL